MLAHPESPDSDMAILQLQDFTIWFKFNLNFNIGHCERREEPERAKRAREKRHNHSGGCFK